MRLVDQTSHGDGVFAKIVLQSAKDARCRDVGVLLVDAMMVMVISHKRSRRAPFPLAPRSPRNGHLEEKVIGGHGGGKDTLGKGVVRPQRGRDELWKFVVTFSVFGRFELRPQALLPSSVLHS